ncbi:MAG: tetratricopeptide repeat protein [Pseudomonadota bacterium]
MASSARAPRRWFLPLPLIAASVALVGCAALGIPPREPSEQAQASEATLYLDAVRELIGQGQYYAAIAHIQEDRRKHGDTIELRLLEADARRNLKQNKTSETLYQSVIRGGADSSLAAKARHGLGLLYAPVNLVAAIKELREATRLKPTNADFRSDLGFALMQARRFAEARVELATANELAPENVAARNNLLILLYVQGEDAAAQRLAGYTRTDPALLARLKTQAQSFKTSKPAPRAR